MLIMLSAASTLYHSNHVQWILMELIHVLIQLLVEIDTDQDHHPNTHMHVVHDMM